MLQEIDDSQSKFTFQYLPESKFPGYASKDTQALLFKWGMQDHMYLHKFSYDQFMQPYQIEAFLLDFFNDAHVQGALRVLGTQDRWGKLGKVTSVSKEETLHTITSLSFFDRLKSQGIVRQSGEIVKCLDEYYDSFLISDELRKCLLMPEFECYDIFSDQDRKEFIFHVLKALALGGRLCQFEDELSPYLETTKKIYKDFIRYDLFMFTKSVVKDQSSGQIKVNSLVYKILTVESSVSPLFPIEHPQNFCYLSIDPVKRHVNVLYHASDTYY